MKKTAAWLLLFALLLPLLLSCEGEDKDILGLIIAYQGPEIDTVEHEFTSDEFYVIAVYPNNVDKELKSSDFKTELEKLENGYFVIKITYRGYEDYAYVRCHVPVYPSELGGS